MSAFVLALAFERPAALFLLAVPIVLLVLAARRPAPRLLATGDLDPWRAESRGGAAVRPRAPRRPTLSLVCALLALACAALAIAGPRAGGARTTWTAVLDASPSMSLEQGASTRRQRAMLAAEELARRNGADLVWRWFERSFERWDVPGALWVTDVVPADPPRFAGYVACGGDAVVGPVAVDGADRIDWDGTRLVRVAGAAPSRSLAAVGFDPAGEDPFARVLAAWAEARGIRVGASPSDEDVALRVVVSDREPARELRAGRDGWTALGLARGAARLDPGSGPPLEPWLAADGVVLVAAKDGAVELAWIPGEPSDPAAFAVSFARLLDERVFPPRGVVALDERVAAGPAGVREPGPTTRAGDAPTTAILGAIAAALALVALVLRRA